MHAVRLCAVQAQVTHMLRWAAELAPTPATSASCWELLTDMITARKEMIWEVAGTPNIVEFSY